MLKTITLKIRDTGSMIVDIDGRPTPDELITTLLNGCLFVMREVHKKSEEAIADEVKKQLFYMFNYRASGVLESFAPEMELHPDLTSEAIMKAENDILADELSKMPVNTPQGD